MATGSESLSCLHSPAPTAMHRRVGGNRTKKVGSIVGVTAGHVRLHCGGNTGVSLEEATGTPQLWEVSRAKLEGPGKHFSIPPSRA